MNTQETPKDATLASPPTRKKKTPSSSPEPQITSSGIADDLLNEALAANVEVSNMPDKLTATNKQINDIVTDISRHYNVPLTLGYIGLCSTLQAGGTNKNKRTNIKITIGGISFESRKINEFIYRYCKNLTPRQLARILSNDIFLIATKYKITGNAYVSLRRYYPQLLLETNPDERFWASDFQAENPNCPEYIRTALRHRYVDKFTSQNRKGDTKKNN
jgi:hypothetical protein